MIEYFESWLKNPNRGEIFDCSALGLLTYPDQVESEDTFSLTVPEDASFLTEEQKGISHFLYSKHFINFESSNSHF